METAKVHLDIPQPCQVISYYTDQHRKHSSWAHKQMHSNSSLARGVDSESKIAFITKPRLLLNQRRFFTDETQAPFWINAPLSYHDGTAHKAKCMT